MSTSLIIGFNILMRIIWVIKVVSAFTSFYLFSVGFKFSIWCMLIRLFWAYLFRFWISCFSFRRLFLFSIRIFILTFFVSFISFTTVFIFFFVSILFSTSFSPFASFFFSFLSAPFWSKLLGIQKENQVAIRVHPVACACKFL